MFLCSNFKPKPYQIAVSTDSNFRRVQQCVEWNFVMGCTRVRNTSEVLSVREREVGLSSTLIKFRSEQ